MLSRKKIKINSKRLAVSFTSCYEIRELYLLFISYYFHFVFPLIVSFCFTAPVISLFLYSNHYHQQHQPSITIIRHHPLQVHLLVILNKTVFPFSNSPKNGKTIQFCCAFLSISCFSKYVLAH